MGKIVRFEPLVPVAEALRQSLAEFTLGDRVIYRGSWGHGPSLPGTICGMGVEKGERVYDVRLDKGDLKWGYENQFSHDDPIALTHGA